MNEDTLIDEIRHYAEHWMDVLGLKRTWLHVGYMNEEQEKDNEHTALICVQHRNEYNRAYIYVRRDQSEREFPLDLSVLHEVCHIWYSAIDDFAAQSSPEGYREGWTHLLETECDDLAMVIWRLTERDRRSRAMDRMLTMPADKVRELMENGH
jgi:hypothetical protein